MNNEVHAPPAVGICLPPELIASFLDGRASAAERRRVVQHALACEMCRFVLSEGAAYAEDSGQPMRSRSVFASSSWMRGLGLAAAAALLLIVGGTQWPSDPSRDPLTAGRGASGAAAGVDPLVSAVGVSRPVEGRLTGGFAWGVWLGPRRGGGAAQAPWEKEAQVLAAAEAIRSAHERDQENSRLLAALGVAHLVLHEDDAAVEALEDARNRRPDDAQVLSDLAVAYLSRGRAQRRAQDVAMALDVAERAIRLKPDLLEAWFNRGLALDALGLRDRARQAWDDYLQRDPKSPWAKEAQQRRERVSGSPQSRRWKEMAPQLASLRQTPDPEAADSLAREFPGLMRGYAEDLLFSSAGRGVDDAGVVSARRVGASLDAHDRQIRDLGDFLASAAQPEARERIATGLDALRELHERFDGAEPGGADAALARADAAFSGNPGNPAARCYVRFYTGLAAFHAGRFGQAIELFRGVESIAAARGYHYLLGRARLTRGLILIRQARIADAIDAYMSAAAAFEDSGDDEYLATAHSYIAECFRELGAWEDAWQWQLASFDRLDAVINPRRRHLILAGAGALLQMQQLSGAALQVQRAELENAERWKGIPALIASWLALARSHEQLGDLPEAFAAVASAESLFSQIADEAIKRNYSIDALITRAQIQQRTDAPASVATLTRVIERLSQSEDVYRLPRLYLARGRAQYAGGHVALAEADWRQGIDALEKHHAFVRGEAARISHFDESWDLYSSLIRLLALDVHDIDGALCVVEYSRGRALAESLGRSPASSRLDSACSSTHRLLRQAADPATRTVVYVALPDRLLMWLIREDGVAFDAEPVTRRRLDQLVRRLVARLRSRSDIQEDVAGLSNLLIAPIASWLPPGTPMVVLPDGPLHVLPFAVLRQGNETLVEQHALSIAPTLALGAHVTAPGTKSAQKRRPVVIVGDPDSEGASRGPVALSAAAREADEIAQLYPDRILLRGPEATKEQFTALLRDAPVIHFAGHAVTNDAYPGNSYLQFAHVDGVNDDASRLYASELQDGSRCPTRLVVLSSCGGARGAISRGEGAISLARAFLSAGVGAVVAGLWDVDDEPTATLMRRFHLAYSRGLAPDEALRAAQMSMLKDPDRTLRAPAAWAGFIVIGKVEKERGNELTN